MILKTFDLDKVRRPCLYNDMLILIYGNLTKSVKHDVDNMLQWFLDKGLEEWEAKWRCQIGWNHNHFSKKDALKHMKEVREAVRKRLPKLLRRLRIDWFESDEREQPINLSFYFDKERL